MGATNASGPRSSGGNAAHMTSALITAAMYEAMSAGA
jgi:hypothetical protein